MSGDFDEQRKMVRAKIASRQTDASKAFEDLLAAATEQVKQTWANGVREHVEKVEPARTQELGPDAVKALKADLSELDARCRTIVQTELDKLPVWDFYRSDGAPDFHDDKYSGFTNFHNTVRYSFPTRLPTTVRTALDEAVSKADAILRKNGWDAGNPGRSNLRHRLVSLPSEPSSTMVDAMSAFSTAADQIRSGRTELSDLDTAESEFKAKSIWDDA